VRSAWTRCSTGQRAQRIDGALVDHGLLDHARRRWGQARRAQERRLRECWAAAPHRQARRQRTSVSIAANTDSGLKREIVLLADMQARNSPQCAVNSRVSRSSAGFGLASRMAPVTAFAASVAIFYSHLHLQWLHLFAAWRMAMQHLGRV